MADNIGVLGANTAVTVGTHTAYTVPASKAAKIKIMWSALMVNTATLVITVNGIDIANIAAASGAEYWWSNNTLIYDEDATPTNKPAGTTALTTVAPAPFEYYLSTGDVVSYTIGVAGITTMNFQVVGTEVDAS
jgi:hypothetical protein|tara:strand:- start:533 stop:934 length:402 start_codon:yes stop_codon:yes gene_type:complete